MWKKTTNLHNFRLFIQKANGMVFLCFITILLFSFSFINYMRAEVLMNNDAKNAICINTWIQVWNDSLTGIERTEFSNYLFSHCNLHFTTADIRKLTFNHYYQNEFLRNP